MKQLDDVAVLLVLLMVLKHHKYLLSYSSILSLYSRALDMITNQFGSVAAATVRNLDIEKLPLLALVYRLRGTTEIFQVRDSRST